jgi:competence ComEA-like helix-hairpin-helix protein
MLFTNSRYFLIYRFRLNALLLGVLWLLTVNCGSNAEKQILSTENPLFPAENAVNINTATAAELEKLPDIGAKTAEKIVAHRTRFGPFRRVEHLMLVEGISDKKFRRIRTLVKVE